MKWLLQRLALSIWIGALICIPLSMMIALCLLPNPLAVVWLLILACSLAIPLDRPISLWAKELCRFSLASAVDYFSLTVHMEDPSAFKEGQSYVIGYEPHSALPVGAPMVFCEHSPLCPPALRTTRTLATSISFYCPVVRHLWWWLGGRPADAATMHSLLSKGNSVLLCPGGVRECTYMKHGEEVAYVRSRTGFVRIALQHGAPIIPVFCFGQTRTFSWVKPGPPVLPAPLVERIARTIGFLPLLIWGVWGTPLPHPVPMSMAIGAPIEVPKLDNPSPEDVALYLGQYVGHLERLYKEFKDVAGYSDVPLRVL
eukprot:jgi/Botrbrau1/16481/Bobra.0142s0075.1